MMPTFPLPPLKFLTAGFPRYGFKAGISGAAFPANWFAVALRALCCHRDSLLCVRDDAPLSTSVRAGCPALPQGPSLRSGLFCPGHIITYPAPSAPLAGTSRLHRMAAYTRCLRCAYSHMPRRPTTGSELSLMLLRNMSSSATTGNFSAAYTQYFTENAGLPLQLTVSAFPLSSHSDSGEGDCIRGFTTDSLALRPATLLALLVGADRIRTQPTRTFTSGLPMVWSPAQSSFTSLTG
jgi:hypothetical protein